MVILGSEVDECSAEVTLVLWNTLIEGGRQSRIVPGGGLGVVVDEIDASGVGQSHFPSAGQRA